MRALLLGLAAPLAAVTFAAAPAAALDPPTARFTATTAAGVTIHHGLPAQFARGFDSDRPHGDHHRDHRRRSGDSIFIYDRDYQGDSAWKSDSFNDWWHDQPERSFPRWMANNQDCERLWWSGGGWRC
jgi:hypothetical protein